MADYLRDELGKLLNQYDEQRRATLAREQKVRDEDALFVAQFAELRRGVIRPALEAAAALLAQRGHIASITEQEFSVAEGGKVSEAWIALRIVVSGAKDESARSLSFSTRHYNKTVWINAGKPLEGSKGTYPMEKIDRRRVEEELVQLVAGVVAGADRGP
jgi:hypothetical protein